MVLLYFACISFTSIVFAIILTLVFSRCGTLSIGFTGEVICGALNETLSWWTPSGRRQWRQTSGQNHQYDISATDLSIDQTWAIAGDLGGGLVLHSLETKTAVVKYQVSLYLLHFFYFNLLYVFNHF